MALGWMLNRSAWPRIEERQQTRVGLVVGVRVRQILPRARDSGDRESRHLRFPTVPARAFLGRKAGVPGLVLPSLNSLPFPVPNFRHVLAVFGDVVFVFEELVPDELPGVGGG